MNYRYAGWMLAVVMFCSTPLALARERGHDIDFTAFGNDPGWQLALTGAGHKVEFSTDAVALVYRYPSLGPVLRRDGKTRIYMVPNSKHTLSVHITQSLCQDSITGKSYETSVTVMLDGASYHGCGSPFL
ncbi:MAG: hypothetical protein WBO57_09695 [Gammaproteobacteria bacterium]